MCSSTPCWRPPCTFILFYFWHGIMCINIVTYLGCYINGGELPIPVDFDNTKSISFCAKQCEAEGKSYFGVQNKNECHCGDWPDVPPTKLKENLCRITCSSEGQDSCGNVDKNSVYRIDARGKQKRNLLFLCSYNTFHPNIQCLVMFGKQLPIRKRIGRSNPMA